MSRAGSSQELVEPMSSGADPRPSLKCGVLRYPSRCDAVWRGGVATIGNFDGVHLGHRRLLEAMWSVPGAGVRTVVSFYPHPLRLLRPEASLRCLNTVREKRNRLAELGVDLLYLVHFTRHIAELSAADFIVRVLIEALGVRCVVLGEDAAIGKGRQGDINTVRTELQRHGVDLLVVPHLWLDRVRPSSRTIRGLIEGGDLRGAARLLGAPFALSGRVVRGDGRGGAVLGFPTANIVPPHSAREPRLLPPRGVYVCRVLLEQRWYNGVANIGVRPTFSGDGERIEVHLFEWGGGALYGRRIEVAFVERLRDERRCSSLDELRELIAADIVAARGILAQEPLPIAQPHKT